jgi:diguanylate cyclase (GGDEF)-like protein
MFDLDHFKSINDRYGHAVGDAALRVFSETIQYTMREGDVIGRLGGEEFAAVVAGSADDAAIAAERVRATFEANGAVIADYHMDATVSIGAADCLAKGCNIGRLLSRADAALYASKQSGRNRVTCASEDVAPAPAAEPRVGDTGQAAGLLHAA